MSDARIDMLRKVSLFAGCSNKQLEFIATQVEEIDIPAGRTLCREAESGGEFFVIVSGTADVSRLGRTLRQLGAGEFFGEIALIEHGPRTATVTAKTAMRCLVLSPGQFSNVLRQDASIAIAVLHAVGERLRVLLGPQEL